MPRAPARLALQGEVTPTRFGEVGRPYRVRRSDDGERVALCSAFDHLYWPGRAIYAGHTLRNRVSLYAGNFENLLAVFDGAHFPINDIAFHPSEPWLAIATGSYDGGYLFEGDLFLWNWQSGECRSLLAESREVVCCRFVAPSRLAVVLRPRDEEEYGDNDAFITYVGVVLDDLRPAQDFGLRPGDADPRLVNLGPSDPASLGFHMGAHSVSGLCAEGRQHLEGLGFEERHRIWDVAWLDAERIAAVHDGCHLEIWGLQGQREAYVHGDGHGVQLLRQPDGWLVHVLQRGNLLTGQPDRSTVFALQGSSLVEWRQFENACALSVDRQGRILARDTGDRGRGRARRDRVLDPSGKVIRETDLGHYDCFNHYVRLDGGDELHFLRGSPPSSHQTKRLCGIDFVGTIRERMIWNDHGEHLMDGCAAFGPRGSLLRAYRVYNPSPTTSKGAVELYSFSAGRALWSSDLDADATCLVTTTDARHVIFALTNGRFGVIDTADGQILHDEQLAVDGVATVATALAIHGQRLLVGTIDGRLLLYALNGQ
jgi:hypothetical protein